MSELEQLRRRYNVAVANGLVTEARRLDRIYKAALKNKTDEESD